MEAVLENPYILLTDKKISNIQELLPILEQVVQQGDVYKRQEQHLPPGIEEEYEG